MSDYSTHAPASKISSLEFTVLVALLMSVVAISIDALLPALDFIRAEVPMSHPNQAQLLISSLFLGMAAGQLICGPLSDATGRKPVLYGGIALYLAGTVLCYFAQSIEGLLLGRIIQGLGVSGPYVSAISIVRDKYAGNEMARVMSLVMLIFILVPAIAPSLGQGILYIADWRAIFLMYLGYALLIGGWIHWRLDETLPKANRIPMTVSGFKAGFAEVISNGPTVCYTLCMGLFFGSFIGYLNSSQQIFQQQFGTGEAFTLYFGFLALVFGGASLVNAKFVQRFGMELLCRRAVLAILVLSAAFLALHAAVQIELWMFLLYASGLFFCFGLVFGNVNAMAMEPMGHVAGIASAVIGATSSLLSLTIGTYIGQQYNGSLIPVTSGFLVLGSICLGLLYLAARLKTQETAATAS
ncbi:multidrug effflux MFS transporter [Rheinheimera marina]|uniref:Bcr/CflA family efflux transporter n=1 Tax=Rheinheimera marina TaxID=1774958 RepID=A0ABV9JKC6_9GAMM